MRTTGRCACDVPRPPPWRRSRPPDARRRPSHPHEQGRARHRAPHRGLNMSIRCARGDMPLGALYGPRDRHSVRAPRPTDARGPVHRHLEGSVSPTGGASVRGLPRRTPEGPVAARASRRRPETGPRHAHLVDADHEPGRARRTLDGGRGDVRRALDGRRALAPRPRRDRGLAVGARRATASSRVLPLGAVANRLTTSGRRLLSARAPSLLLTFVRYERTRYERERTREERGVGVVVGGGARATC